MHFEGKGGGTESPDSKTGHGQVPEDESTQPKRPPDQNSKGHLTKGRSQDVTWTRLDSVVRMAQRSMLCSSDSCHNSGRYCSSELT